MESCERCGGSGIDYCDSCYEEGLDGVGHGPCPDCEPATVGEVVSGLLRPEWFGSAS